MARRRATLPFLLLAGLMLALLVAAQASPAAADTRCAELINTRCDQCHYKTRVCQVLGTKSRWGWKRTMKRMLAYGARLTDDERDYLVDCLAAAPKGADYVCNYK